MSWTLPKYEYKNVSKKTARMVEQEYMDFMLGRAKSPEEREDDDGLYINNDSFRWDAKNKCWQREVEIKEPPPKYLIFSAYGSFTLPNGHNFVVFRIPGSGVNWHKQILPGIQGVIKKLLKTNKKVILNIDPAVTKGDYEKVWESKKYYRFDFKKDRFVRKLK